MGLLTENKGIVARRQSPSRVPELPCKRKENS